MEDRQPTYEELLLKVREQEAQEEIFRSVIKQMENLYAQIVASQNEIEQKNKELKEEREKLQTLNDTLQRISLQDGLTGISNRRHFDEIIEREWMHAVRNSRTISFLLADIDYFKTYNDEYGHLEGDECLKMVAKAVNNIPRRHIDMVARYGGEEFAVLLPETDINGAVRVAESILSSVRDLKIVHKGSMVHEYVTVSIGVTAVVPIRGMKSAHLIHNADNALYKAKRAGRNRYVVY